MKTTKSKRGRPTKLDSERSVAINQTFPPEQYAILAEAGDGKAARGIRLAVEKFCKFYSLKNKGK